MKANYGPAGSGPATRGHRDLRVRPRLRSGRRLAGVAGGVTVALDLRFQTIRDLAIRTLRLCW
jgi:hypothetical protein